MARMLIGSIEPFRLNEDFALYHERFMNLMRCNDVRDDTVRLTFFINFVGTEVYDVMHALHAPNKRGTWTFKTTSMLLIKHFQQWPNPMAERFVFYKRAQLAHESVNDFSAELRKMATTCNFGTFLESALRDRFVCGMRCVRAQGQLLGEQNLTMRMALRMALTMEQTANEARQRDEELRRRLQRAAEEGRLLYRVRQAEWQLGRQPQPPPAGATRFGGGANYVLQTKIRNQIRNRAVTMDWHTARPCDSGGEAATVASADVADVLPTTEVVACYRCNVTGHLVRNCPMMVQQFGDPEILLTEEQQCLLTTRVS